MPSWCSLTSRFLLLSRKLNRLLKTPSHSAFGRILWLLDEPGDVRCRTGLRSRRVVQRPRLEDRMARGCPLQAIMTQVAAALAGLHR